MIPIILRRRNLIRLKNSKTTKRMMKISTISCALLSSSTTTTSKRRTTICQLGTLLSSCLRKMVLYLIQVNIILTLIRIFWTMACSKWCRLQVSSWSMVSTINKVLIMKSLCFQLTPSIWSRTPNGKLQMQFSWFASWWQYFYPWHSKQWWQRKMKASLKVSFN
jgi:hypothetical protein